MSSATTLSETATLEVLEDVIEQGLVAFIKVGQALLRIRDSRLYEQNGYPSFEEYCESRWGISLPHSAYIVRASEAAAILPDELPKPTRPAHAEPLSKLRKYGEDSEELIQRAWTRALEDAGDHAYVTADLVAANVNRIILDRERPWLSKFVGEGAVSINEAYALHKALRKNPSFEQACQTFKILDARVVSTLGGWQGKYPDEVSDILQSGFLQDGTKAIRLESITQPDLAAYFKRLYAEEKISTALNGRSHATVYVDKRPKKDDDTVLGIIFGRSLDSEQVARVLKRVNDYVDQLKL